jgi:hypothetical protein
MEISTRNLEGLPDIVRLRRLLQSMAMLDAIFQPKEYLRYYSFNAHWGQGEMMGSMSDGSGDEFSALFNRHGAFLKGFAHESCAARIASQHYYRDLPHQFEQCSREAAFGPDAVSFCVWRLVDQPRWSCSRVALFARASDGSADILSMLDGAPLTYTVWAKEYYERDVALEAVEHVYQHRPLSQELVAAINPRQSLERLASEIVQIGYPV